MFVQRNSKKDTANEILDELIIFGEKNANIVTMIISDEYDIKSFGENFWKTKYNNQYPSEILYNLAEEDVLKHKSISKLSEELGIQNRLTFSELRDMWYSEQPGIPLWHYIEIKDSELSVKIKDELLKETNPTQEELKVAFENLEDKYKKSDYRINGIEIMNYNYEINELESIIQNNIDKEAIDIKETIDILNGEIPDASFKAIELESYEMQKEDIYSISTGDILVEKKVGDLVKGNLENQYFYIVNKEGGEMLTFQDAPQLAENNYINEIYEKRIKNIQCELKKETNEKCKISFIEYYMS